MDGRVARSEAIRVLLQDGPGRYGRRSPWGIGSGHVISRFREGEVYPWNEGTWKIIVHGWARRPFWRSDRWKECDSWEYLDGFQKLYANLSAPALARNFGFRHTFSELLLASGSSFEMALKLELPWKGVTKRFQNLRHAIRLLDVFV